MKLFLAYDHSDRDLALRLEVQFHPIIMRGEVEIWHQDKITAGSSISIEIERNLSNSDVVVFFLSSDFLASNFFNEIEDEVIRLVNKRLIRLVPIVARPCLWEYSKFNSELNVQVLPKNGKAISSFASEREILHEICKDLLKIHTPAIPTTPYVDRGLIDTGTPQNFNREKLIAHLRELLSNNQTNEVFDILDEVLAGADSELTNTVILLKSRYNRAARDQRSGIITNENAHVENNGILHALLNLLDDIPNEIGVSNLESSSTYLDEVKKTTGFEQEQKKYKELFVLIRDKDKEVDAIFSSVASRINLKKGHPNEQKFAAIRQRHERLRKDIDVAEISEVTEKELDVIRQELIELVDEMQTEESNQVKDVAAEGQDITTSDTIYLNEAKLIFVGNGGVGKTTLRENLRSSQYRLGKHLSTEGLDVITWSMPVDDIPGVNKFIFNIWDFGGQSRYRAIQQFFSTPKALYVFVTTPLERENSEEDDYSGLDYWLNFVHLFGYDIEDDRHSPVIFVMNKCDLGGNQTIEKERIRKNFTSVKDFILVSCETGQGLDELQEALQKRLKDTHMINRSFPRSWVSVKEKLQKKSEVYDLISYSEYLDIFRQLVPFSNDDQANIAEEAQKLDHLQREGKIENYLNDFFNKLQFSVALPFWDKVKNEPNGIKQLSEQLILEQKAKVLTQYLHTAGLLLHFPKVQCLLDKLVLKPDWARKLAYDLFSSPYAAGGILKHSDLVKIFPDDERKRTYSMDLLQSYHLCYEEVIAGEISYFIPSLFPQEKPIGVINLGDLPDSKTFECSFNPIIPAEFLPRLISRMFKYISEQNVFWRGGALFKREKAEAKKLHPAFALATEHWRENKISITIVGEGWAELLSVLANAVYDITNAIKDYRPNTQLGISETLRFYNAPKVNDLSALRQIDNNNHLLPSQLKKIMPKKASKKPKLSQPQEQLKLPSEIDVYPQRRMLFLAACPIDKQEIRMITEIDSVKRVLMELRKEKEIDLITELNVQAEALTNVLSRNSADYIHFSLHGSKSGFLLFVQEEKKEARIDASELQDIFDQILMGNHKIKLVCFSACHSLVYAESLAKSIPYTLGMSGFFPVEAAQLFAKVFYSYWFNQHAIEFCFKQSLRAIKRADFPSQENIPIHDMPKLFVNNILQTIEI